MNKKMRLGDMLIERGLISEEQLRYALKVQREKGQKLGATLIELKIITELQLFQSLEIQFGIPYIDINTLNIDPKVPKLITENLAKMHTAIPVQLMKGRLIVAMADPLDIIAKDDIRFATGLEVDVVMSSMQDIIRAIPRYYDISESAEKAAREYTEQTTALLDSDEQEESDDVSNAPMVRLVNSVISQAVRKRASDIHIEPYENRVRIRYRIDGSLREEMATPKNTHGAIVTRIKIMGKMNISERRIPQDGRIETTIEGYQVDMRISVLPTVHGEKIVIRLLDRSNIAIDKSQLGFNKVNLERLDKILSVPEGIVLVTGPTGSGKTTTLYAVLKEYNKIDTNIITVEDPVEYRLDGINQVQVNVKAGLTFASGLRSILRQDPDIVMVGEIRDTETAQIAIRAAITGHIVLSTLHTNDTASTLSRLVDMGIENFLVGTATVGVVAQRLVKRICIKCAEQYTPSKEDLSVLNLPLDSKLALTRGKGCNSCGQTGYSGRVAVHEVLIVDKAVKDLMLTGATSEKIKEIAIKNGMYTLYDSAKELVLDGVTTVDELLRIAFSVD